MTKHDIHYQNNPFNIGLNGLQLLFKRAQSVGIYAAILAGIGILISTAANVIDTVSKMNTPDYDTSPYVMHASSTPSSVNVGVLIAVLVGVLLVAVITMLVSALLYGVLEYTSAKLAQGKNVTLGEALSATFKRLPGYFWVYVVMFVKIFLWTLLLIVPGIIMAVRYSLSGIVFFAENKRGNAAVKRSAELTKGAWFTTFAGTGLWNLITLGMIPWVITPSANAILYRQFKATTDSGSKKQGAHWLSWLTFFGPLVLFVILFGFIILFALVIFGLWLAK